MDTQAAPATSVPGNAWIPNLLLMAFVILLCLLSGELALRRWFPMGTLLERDPRYLYKYVLGARKRKEPFPESGAPAVVVAINKAAKRGDLISAGLTNRIVVYGDSFIAAEGTPLKATFVYQLEQLSAPNFPGELKYSTPARRGTVPIWRA